MKLAIHQPYFFPYMGYFSLINLADQFILFDTPQFIRHGWIERNQILKPNGESLYIKVPLVKHKRETVINEIQIRETENWKAKILAQLVPYKKKAPNYYKVIELLEEIFSFETASIVEFNFHSLKLICEYIGIKTPIKVWSQLNVEIEPVNAPDEWGLQICKALDAETYVNLEGGINFFDRSKYETKGISIQFLKYNPINYSQLTDDFLPYLSIIDVMMFNTKEEINERLKSYTLI